MLKVCQGSPGELAEEKIKEEFTMATAKTPKAAEAEKIQKAEETVKVEKAEKVEKAAEKVEKAAVKEEKAAEKVEKKAEKVEKKTEKKAAAKPAQKEEEVFVQFGSEEWNVAQLKQAAQDAYVAEGHRASTIKKLSVYIKPEEHKAYYVINEKITGSVDL